MTFTKEFEDSESDSNQYRIISSNDTDNTSLIEKVYIYFRWMYKERKKLNSLINYELKQGVLGTNLSYLWWFLDPTLNFFCYWLLVTFLGRHSINNIPYPLFIITAIFPWHFTNKCINNSANIWERYETLIHQNRFPYLFLLLASLSKEFILYMLSFIIIIGTCISLGYLPTAQWLLLPIVFVYQVVFTLALMIINSFFSFLFYDYKKILPFLLRIWFFASPVVWSLSDSFAKAHTILLLNPNVFSFEGIRGILLYHTGLNWIHFESYFFSAFLMLVALLLFFIAKEPHINRYI